jgi:hypothetical protein
MTEPHIYFSAQMTTAGIPKRVERVAIYAQGAPKQHEDGSKSIHLNWPMLILSEFAVDPAKIAKTVADVLNENAHRFFPDAEQPASLVKAAATLRAAVLRALTEVPEPGSCLNFLACRSAPDCPESFCAALSPTCGAMAWSNTSAVSGPTTAHRLALATP